MNASIITLQLIVVAHIWIYLPLPLMIDPIWIKDPIIPLICFQIPSQLPMKTMLVLWPPLLIFQNSVYQLLTILTIAMPWKIISLTVSGQKYDTDLGSMIKKMLRKDGGSISPCALINTRNFITVIGFLVLIQRRVISSWNINIVWRKYSVDCCVCLPSILHFTCWTHFCACFLPVPLITPCYNHFVLYDWNFDHFLFLLTVWMHVMTSLSDS